mmetsp:Transcript_149845/g.481381  ORF Transcript_149845/g.481381 Transcript_149845/m.481381 type:complete len:359 (+) Transcript_149845:365-1441(+)
MLRWGRLQGNGELRGQAQDGHSAIVADHRTTADIDEKLRTGGPGGGRGDAVAATSEAKLPFQIDRVGRAADVLGEIPDIEQRTTLHEEDARPSWRPCHGRIAAGRLCDGARPVGDRDAERAVEECQVTFRVGRQEQAREEWTEGSTARLLQGWAKWFLAGLLIEERVRQLEAPRAVGHRGRKLAAGLPEPRRGDDDELRLLLRMDAEVRRPQKVTQKMRAFGKAHGALKRQFDALVAHIAQLEDAPKAYDTHHIQREDQRVAADHIGAAHAANLHAVDSTSSQIVAARRFSAAAALLGTGDAEWRRIIVETPAPHGGRCGEREQVRGEDCDVPDGALKVSNLRIRAEPAVGPVCGASP